MSQRFFLLRWCKSSNRANNARDKFTDQKIMKCVLAYQPYKDANRVIDLSKGISYIKEIHHLGLVMLQSILYVFWNYEETYVYIFLLS